MWGQQQVRETISIAKQRFRHRHLCEPRSGGSILVGFRICLLLESYLFLFQIKKIRVFRLKLSSSFEDLTMPNIDS